MPAIEIGSVEDLKRLSPLDSQVSPNLPARAAKSRDWPKPMANEAFHGIAGEVVRMIEPHSEADPAALMIQFLVCFGNLIGRAAHFRAEADRHFTNLFAVIVGESSKGRKGTSLGQIQNVIGTADIAWRDSRVQGGLSSGEGLIWAVRDEMRGLGKGKDKGKLVVLDPGEQDKRLLATETEFSRVLVVSERDSNTLSAIIRQAWDNGNLRVMTKAQAVASNAHISIVGHITRDELRRLLTSTAAGNGFANRFLWVCAKRSKLLPEGGDLNEVDLAPATRQISTAVEFARTQTLMKRDEAARQLWADLYVTLSEPAPGLLGSVTSRGEAQTMRLALLYAVLDRSRDICTHHLEAAHAVWRYCFDSAKYVFGDASGDATADEILRALRARPDGMTRTEIRDFFQRNKRSDEISRALSVLETQGTAFPAMESVPGQARATERWIAK
jgi:hypothetical protein